MLVRMPAVHDDIHTIEPAFEEFLVGPELQRGRHHAVGIGQHPVLGDDGVAFDGARGGQGTIVTDSRPA